MVSSSALLSGLLIKRLDHLGLVAGICKELKIAETIDAIIPKSQDCHVTHGQALVAMILNGLGFHSRTLHLFPAFFEQKPTERLIGNDIEPQHLNDDVIGRALDAFYNEGVSALYQHLSAKVIQHLKLKSDAIHIDITSFHVDGKYEFAEDDDTDRISLVKGYSRDHRPDLNQVVLELICENRAGIPVYMQALSGNTNDGKAFAEVTKNHIRCLKAAQQSRYFVGDAALYTPQSLQALHQQKQLFVTRVPATLKAAKACISQFAQEDIIQLENGYSGYWSCNEHADVPQKWLVLGSEKAKQKELKTLDKRLLKSTQKEYKAFQTLCQQGFACKVDAQKALERFKKTVKLTELSMTGYDCQAVYKGKGRPKKGAEPDSYTYYLKGHIATSLEQVKKLKDELGIFIISTNDLSDKLEMTELLNIYKSQQSVERGFRFLKSPEFLTSSIFLKKPERIEALLMVMTCCLMIYAALEYQIRQRLKEKQQYFPDTKKKPYQRPTARWVLCCFEGIYELTTDTETVIQNIDERQRIIINILGLDCQQIYS